MSFFRGKLPLTLEQLELETLLTRLNEMEIGQEITLHDRANDGFGGMVVKRHSKRTFVFQREHFQGRSRWADDAEEMRHELRAYLGSGKLNDPDNIKGW